MRTAFFGFLLLILLASCIGNKPKRQKPYANRPEYADLTFNNADEAIFALDSLDSANLVKQYLLPGEEEDPFMVQDPKKKKKSKKAKPKKNEFYGIKTKRGFTRSGMKDDLVIETFHFIPELPPPPNPYIRDYWWYDIERREVSRNREVANKKGYILHGPYQRSIGGNIVEEGNFFKGLKHGRWMLYNRDFIVQNKSNYYMGWPLESEFEFYDVSDQRIRQILPIEYGEREGNFYIFHDNGQLAVSGQYRFNQRVGVWTEYYRQQRRAKRQIQYSPDPFDREFRPYIIREWDERGNLIYERPER
jgi:hypothetical protein